MVVSLSSILDQLVEKKAVASAIAGIAERHQDMVNLVEKWSAVNSGSRNLSGLQQMENLIAAAFEGLGADIRFIELGESELVDADGNAVQVPNGRMISISKNPEANRKVLLTGHTDTVFPENSGFQQAKWLNDNTLNGPGVADMKGGIIVILNALQAFENGPYGGKIGWEVLLSPDEETGSIMSGPILADRAKAADIGLTYEPALADGTLAGARKGSGNYTLVVRGRAAHAGREFFEGRNAVVLLSRIIADLAALTNGRPELTVNPAVIKGGVAPNVVPDMAFCRFNVRLKTIEDGEWFTASLEKILKKYRAEDGFELALHGGINRPPKVLSEANLKLMDAIRACGSDLDIDIRYVATGGCCEGNNLAAAGLPNVDTLGVRGGAIHSEDEFVLVDSFVERAQLSTLILSAFADGQFDDVLRAKGRQK